MTLSDAPQHLRDFLLANATLAALVGTRVYAERTEPVEGYKLGDGPCVCFLVGGAMDYSGALQRARVQFKCYGADEIVTNAAHRALHNALERQSGQYIRWAISQTLGQTLRELDTKWTFVLSYFQIWIL